MKVAATSKAKLVKTSFSLLAVIIVMLSSALRAAENPYDTFGKVLMPLVSVLAEKGSTPNRAALLNIELEEAADAPKELKDARVEISFQAPNKLKIQGPILGEQLTICRRGQELWVTPGAKAEALINAASADKKLPPPNPDFELAPFKLPIPAKQLVFLPALFKVQAAGEEAVGNQTCRVLDVRLMPELERSLTGEKGWSARIWVNPENKPVRLQVRKDEKSIATVRFTKVEFLPSLPKETWKPALEQADDVLKITPERFDQLVRALVGAK